MGLYGQGKVPPTELKDARIQLHWAAQVLSAAADRWLQAQPDDGHTSMAWSSDAGSLIGGPVASGVQLALAVHAFELRAVRGGRTQTALSLTGRASRRFLDSAIAAGHALIDHAAR